MQDSSEDNYISIGEGIKSVPIRQLEECISAAIAKEIKGSKFSCYIAKIKISDLGGVKLKIELANNHNDIEL